MTSNESEQRQGFCPVYDMECPSGLEAAQECQNRFNADYNPLTSFRDSEIEHCAIYRLEQQEAASHASAVEPAENQNISKNGE